MKLTFADFVASSALDKRLQLYSEQAFYFSFFEDFVAAPSASQGMVFNSHLSE